MRDLEFAKRTLNASGLALVIVKDGVVLFEDDSPGILGFLRAVDELKERLVECSVGDRVVGRAVAMLCVYVRAKSVYAVTLSEGGRETLKSFGVYFEFERLVPKILDMAKKDVCPFEKLAEKALSPKEAYERLRAFLRREAL